MALFIISEWDTESQTHVPLTIAQSITTFSVLSILICLEHNHHKLCNVRNILNHDCFTGIVNLAKIRMITISRQFLIHLLMHLANNTCVQYLQPLICHFLFAHRIELYINIAWYKKTISRNKSKIAQKYIDSSSATGKPVYSRSEVLRKPRTFPHHLQFL